jgi:hypothetical protein
VRAQLWRRSRFLANVTRFWLSVAAAALVLAVTPAAQAAFPGRNGFIAYVHFSSGGRGEEGEGPNTSVRSLLVGRMFGHERFTLRTCTTIDDVPQDAACPGSWDSPPTHPPESSCWWTPAISWRS